jgi:uncharacterized protein (DUF1778 family)
LAFLSHISTFCGHFAVIQTSRVPSAVSHGRGSPRHLDLSGRTPYALLMTSSPTAKTCRIKIRITEEERNLEQAAAAFSGETLSEFVRRAARCEAERTLAGRTRYVLDDGAAHRFLSALEQPSPDSERELRRLVEKPSVLPEA